VDGREPEDGLKKARKYHHNIEVGVDLRTEVVQCITSSFFLKLL